MKSLAIRRAAARLIDENLVTPVILFILCLPLAVFFAKDFTSWLSSAFGAAMITRFLFAGFFVECLSFRLFKNTLGKHLLGIALSKENRPLRFFEALRRQTYTMRYTFWLFVGSPLLGAFAYGFWCNTMDSDGACDYDKEKNIVCSFNQISVLRVIGAVCVGLVALVAALIPILLLRIISQPSR